MSLCSSGDEVLTFEPFYTSYVSYVEFSGAKLVTSPMLLNASTKEWQYDFEAFEKQINAKTKAVLITNPHNPTGKTFTKEELEKLSNVLKKHPNVVVVSDDVYYHLHFDNKKYHKFADIDDNFKKTITIYSAGKMM